MTNEKKKNASGFSKFVERISWFDERLAEFAGWIVIVMMVTISYDVAMRYLFQAPTVWSFELNRYMLILVMFFAGPWALPAGGHVAVDIFTEHMETRKKAILEIITAVMAILYMASFFRSSWIFTWDAWTGNIVSTEYLAWPLWPVRSFLVIGSFLLGLEFIFRVVRNIDILTRTRQAERQGGI